jgi:hypothetical protein
VPIGNEKHTDEGLVVVPFCESLNREGGVLGFNSPARLFLLAVVGSSDSFAWRCILSGPCDHEWLQLEGQCYRKCAYCERAERLVGERWEYVSPAARKPINVFAVKGKHQVSFANLEKAQRDLRNYWK